MNIVIVSGRSGSGKSITLNVLEDLGFYCIDNLPAPLVPTLITHIRGQHEKIAIGIDARNLPKDLEQIHALVQALKQPNASYELLYLDADDQTLIKRFNETRRKHPLTSSILSLAEAIQKEKQVLAPIEDLADLRIDTTEYTLHQLRDRLKNRFQTDTQGLSLLIQSFGYKFGVPSDSDYVFDVRCLPNPYWQANLRALTGRDEEVAVFLNAHPETKKMVEAITHFMKNFLGYYGTGHRTYLTISIGCTGGQHRSVYVAEKLYAHFSSLYNHLQIRHRELSA